MSAIPRKGWCPGALRPMAAEDGLIVRIKPRGGTLAAATAHALADLAEAHGNGRLELTARANLQMRGVGEPALPRLLDGLRALGLVDASAQAEAVRNVVASPLAGCHAGLDIRPLVAALERRLADDSALHALPAKFGILVDDGSHPSLADVSADLRFDWAGDRFSIGLGGARADALRIGDCAPDALVERAAGIGRAISSLRPRERAWRFRDIVQRSGAASVAAACGGRPGHALPALSPTSIRRVVGLHAMDRRGLDDAGRPCLGIAAPFGRMDPAMLRAAADAAAGELRLTPWRVVLLPGTTAARVCGFLTDPDDPRLAVAACVGAAGCARGTTDTRADAAELARAIGAHDGIALHVSGCEKGCAKPSATRLTLVARHGRYDLVRDGDAGGVPSLRGLDLPSARRALIAARA